MAATAGTTWASVVGGDVVPERDVGVPYSGLESKEDTHPPAIV